MASTCDTDAIYIATLYTPTGPFTIPTLQVVYNNSPAGDKSIVLTGLPLDGVSIENPAGNGTTNLFSVSNNTTRTDLFSVNNDGSTIIGGNSNASLNPATLATIPDNTLIVNKSNGLSVVNLLPGQGNANLPGGSSPTTAPNINVVPVPQLINTPPLGSYTGSLNLPSAAAPQNTAYGLTLKLLGVSTDPVPKDVFYLTVQSVLYPNINGGLTNTTPTVIESSSLAGVSVSFPYAAPNYSFTISNGTTADINWTVVEEFVSMNTV